MLVWSDQAPSKRGLLLALAASLAFNTAMLAHRVKQGTTGAQQQSGSAAGTVVADWTAAARNSTGLQGSFTHPLPAASAQAPAPRPSLLIVLARHEEDIRWLDALPAAVRQAPNLSIAIYQAPPGGDVQRRPSDEALAAARAAAAAPAQPAVDPEWFSRFWPVRRTPMNRGREAM